MQELFADKPWVQPLSVAGSHVNESEKEKENDPSQKCIKKRKLNTYIQQYIVDKKNKGKEEKCGKNSIIKE
ncbi:uncharacterized protein LOC113562318 [Ooceraea biroi]|uniref:uncharacterized protein LOC113562318 n=1 Tax=Ooceraea biroi TaxID=2015173 RepID=UPI000F076AA6|nr:uncharacterized protein LOC113562318 [Ooceraea biroi]